MSSPMKKKHENGVLKKVTMTLLPPMKKKNKQDETYKRLLSSTYEIPTTSSSLENSGEKTPCLRSLQESYEVTKNQIYPLFEIKLHRFA